MEFSSLVRTSFQCTELHWNSKCSLISRYNWTTNKQDWCTTHKRNTRNSTSPLRKAKKENAHVSTWFPLLKSSRVISETENFSLFFFLLQCWGIIKEQFHCFITEFFHCKSSPQYIRMALNDKFTNCYIVTYRSFTKIQLHVSRELLSLGDY